MGCIDIIRGSEQPYLSQVLILLQKRGAIGDDLEILSPKSPATAGTENRAGSFAPTSTPSVAFDDFYAILTILL